MEPEDILGIKNSKLNLAYLSENVSDPSLLPNFPKGSLHGIPVLGITEHLAGPAALEILASEGAVVVNIEPLEGDPARNYLCSDAFATYNAGKMSISMNLKKDPIYGSLLREALIIVDNRSKRARQKDKTLQNFLNDRNKPRRIIYCVISGFLGEDEYKPGNDVTVQAASGIASVNGPAEGQPLKVGFTVLDMSTADWVVIAIQNQLFSMIRSIPIPKENNKVIPVDVTLAGVAARFLPSYYLQARKGEKIKQRQGNQDNFISIFSFFKTQDHKYIAIGTLTNIKFKIFCYEVIVRADLANDFPSNKLRIQENDFLHREIQQEIDKKPRNFWITKLNQHEITYSEVNTVEEAVQLKSTEHVFTKTHGGTMIIARPDGIKPMLDDAPALNQHGAIIRNLLKES